MRIVTGMMLVLMLGLCTGVALADPNTPLVEKPWNFFPQGLRATIPEVEPNETCLTAMQVECGDIVDPASISSGTDVDWYKLSNVPAGTVLIISTGDGANCGSPYLYDSYIELWYNCGTARVAYNDDFGGTYYSQITYTVPAGAGGEYEVKVRGYSSSYTGCYKVAFQCQVPQPPPPNDTCEGAIDIPRCASGQIVGDNTWSLNQYDPLSGGCTRYAAAGNDVTYRLNLQAQDHVVLTYTMPGKDASLYIITDCSSPSTTCVKGVDSTVTTPEVLHWYAPAAGTYYLIADTYGSGGAPFTLDYAITCSEPSGACCASDGTCTVTVQAGCLSPSIWHGEWVDCSVAQCPQPPTGACCNHATGDCTVTTEAGCSFVWLGPGVVCDAQTCPVPPPTGACCNHATGECEVTTQAACTFEWLGANIPCDVQTCPLPPATGACCDRATGACTITTQTACTFEWLGANIPCSTDVCPIPPPPTGACCDLATGACSITTAADCHFQWLGANIPCNVQTCPVPPPPTAACCDPATGACAMRAQADCQAPLVWHPGVACTPSNPCTPPVPVEKATWGKIKSNYR
jgi:hypothetical protein